MYETMKLHGNVLQSYIPPNGKGNTWLQIIALFASAMGALSTGSMGAWTSPSIPILTSNTSGIDPMSLEEASYLAVIPPIAAVVLSPIITLLVDGIGRQKTIMIMTVSYLTSWLLIAFAQTLHTFYLARVLTGLGDVTFFTVVPMYIGEVAQPEVRSTWGNLIAFFAFLGQFVVNVIGSYCDIATTAIILSCVPLLQFVLIATMPESPYFFLLKNREMEARTSLKILRWTENIENEFSELSNNVQQQLSESGTFKDLFVDPTHRKALIIAVSLRTFQQFSGLPAFFMYAQYMFIQAGSDLSASTSAIVFTGVFMVVITTCAFFVGKFGRKPLMIVSCFGCGIALAIESAYFYIHENTDLNISNFTWVPLAGMLLYVFLCSAGLAIIPTLMMGELFAASVKGKAMCVLNICFSVVVITVGKLFQTLSVNFGMCIPFSVFTVCCFSATAFSYYCIPETKNKTLEEIQLSLKRKKINTKGINNNRV